MTRTLLLLSHHTATLFREDLLLKQAAMERYGLATPLITHDIVADTRPPDSLVSIEPYGGLQEAKHGGVKAWTLGKLRSTTWTRKGFKEPKPGQPSDFNKWFSNVLSKPAEVFVAAGHHGSIKDGTMFWGNQIDNDRHQYIPQAGIATQLSGGKPELSIVGFKTADRDVAINMSFDASQAVSSCRLVIVLGCSGVDLADQWQSWVKAGHAQKKPPLVLGWYGTHSMPKDNDPNFSPLFWKLVAAAALNAACTTLSDLIEKDPASVVKAWGAALKATYKGHPRRGHLWYWVDPKKHPEGAGALLPNGKVWKVTRVDGDIEPHP